MSAPKRDKNGHFVKATKNAEQEKGSPSAPPAKQRHICEECEQEYEEQRIIVRGRVLYVRHCPGCCPDPMLLLRGY